eukprot:maker-scaffold_33-snap-gene-2.4-mRNA-1 protein AED:0.07 eAED:0.07 QI:6/1/0.66/1/1/1/3/0/396
MTLKFQMKKISQFLQRRYFQSTRNLREINSIKLWNKPLLSSFNSSKPFLGLFGITAVIFTGFQLNQPVEANCDFPQYDSPDRSKLFTSSIADAVEIASPSLVNLTLSMGDQVLGAGSGFIYNSNQALVATNFHVVQMCVQSNFTSRIQINATLSNGESYRAKVYGFDQATDLALLQLDFSNSSGQLEELKMGSSDRVRPGEWVMALGSPLKLSNTVTAGIVSSVNRKASELGLTQKRTDYIQTDAAINAGNSGGPLINLKGEVIGINTMKVQGTGGIGFAIPIDTAKLVLRQLMEKKHVDRPFLGLRMAGTFSSSLSTAVKRDKGNVAIVAVARGSPADQAALKPGDTLLKINGKRIETSYDVIKEVGYDIGKTHEIEIQDRSGRMRTVYVTTVRQ